MRVSGGTAITRVAVTVFDAYGIDRVGRPVRHSSVRTVKVVKEVMYWRSRTLDRVLDA